MSEEQKAIADAYRAAYAALYGERQVNFLQLEYRGAGWWSISNDYYSRFRTSRLKEMTRTLLERAAAQVK